MQCLKRGCGNSMNIIRRCLNSIVKTVTVDKDSSRPNGCGLFDDYKILFNFALVNTKTYEGN